MVGIGGIGMSALAQLYRTRDYVVSGSDREASPTTTLLESKGITVSIGEDAARVPKDIDLLVYSDAVPAGNAERRRARALGIPEQSYFEAVGDISKTRFTIAIAGSHGKTTTTALLAKILHDAGAAPNAIVGSLVKDFGGSNFLEGKSGGPMVVEACEYKDHILKLFPSILVVTNLEWDHTDYFKDFEQLKKTFIQAVQKLPPNGALVVDASTDVGRELASFASCRVIDYGEVPAPQKLQLLGAFNVQNAKAAIAAAKAYRSELPDALLYESVGKFRGAWRRFEYKGTTKKGSLVYDDYAHHPTEVATTVRAVREKFPDKKLVVAFHPHLFSRTRDLMEDFAVSFGAADEVVVAPIYAAREEPIPGVTSEALAERIALSGTTARAVGDFMEAEKLLREHDGADTLILTMGAGDIYKVADALVAPPFALAYTYS